MTDLQQALHTTAATVAGGSQPNGYADVLVAEHFGVNDLGRLRALCYSAVRDAGLAHPRAVTFVWAINEGLVNAIQHGGGRGELIVLAHAAVMVAEITDAGPVTPVATQLPRHEDDSDGGHGLWAARRLVDELTLTPGPEGTRLRLEIVRVG